MCFTILMIWKKQTQSKWKYLSWMFYCASHPAELIHYRPLETGNVILIPIGLITLWLQRLSAPKQTSISQRGFVVPTMPDTQLSLTEIALFTLNYSRLNQASSLEGKVAQWLPWHYLHHFKRTCINFSIAIHFLRLMVSCDPNKMDTDI